MPHRFGDLYENGYRYGFNDKEKDNELKGGGNSYDFEARIYDPRVGRWFSRDPISHSSSSPYSYVENNPMIYIDQDGEDNIIYLVILPSAYAKLTKAQINEIKKSANEKLAALGLKTRVEIFEDKKWLGPVYCPPTQFDSHNIDDTDSFVVIGEGKSIIKEFDKSTNNYNDISERVIKQDVNNPDLYELASADPTGEQPLKGRFSQRKKFKVWQPNFIQV